jgi:hypothetical protein
VSRCRVELALVLGLVLGAGGARAEPVGPARVSLDYTRDDGARSCLARDELVSAVEMRLGRPVFVDAAQADLIVEVRARRTGRRFVVDVGMFDRGHVALGERQLSTHAPHCSALDDSLALVLSLAADAPPPQPASPPEQALASSAPPFVPTTITIPASTHAPRLGARFEPSLGVGLIVGPMPGVAAGLELGLTVRSGAFWPVSLHAAGWWPRTHDAGAERGARFSAKSLQVGVCPWEGSLGQLPLRACVLQWFGRITARGFGFDEDQQSEHWAVAFGAGATVGHWFGPVLVSVDGALLVPPVRRRYFFANVADTTTLHEEPWLFGAAGMRLGTEF